jgi:hypothetical protein
MCQMLSVPDHGGLPSEIVMFRVQFLPIYKKAAIQDMRSFSLQPLGLLPK